MKTPAFLVRALIALISVTTFAAPPSGEVPLGTAKNLALALASQQLVAPTIASSQLYRDLDGEPAVWVFELRGENDDTPLAVVAAARRDLPPIVMHWRGQPWHSNPQFMSSARAQVAEFKRSGAKADWTDLRWGGPFDLWVPRNEADGAQTFAGLRNNMELTQADVQATAAERRAAAAIAAASPDISRMWADVARASQQVLSGTPPLARDPQFGSTRYISRVPYLNQGQVADCGIVSMMDILLYLDANGYPTLVNENDLNGLRLRLRTLFQWTSTGNYIDIGVAGTRTYIAERGLTGFTCSYVARGNYRGANATNLSFADVTSEINAGRPLQLLVNGYRQTNSTDESYGNHFVAGVGYYSGSVGGVTSSSWVIVNDNWAGSFTNPYTNPPNPYLDFTQCVGVIKVIPPARATVAATAVAIDSPTNNSTVNLGANANFVARVSAPSGVTVARVEFRAGSTLLRSATAPDSGSTSLYSTSWSPQQAGNYALTATVIDSLNRSATATTNVSVSSSNASPVVGWSVPQFDNTQILSANPTDLSVTATDSDGSVASVEFVLLGGSATSLGRVTPSSSTFTTLRGIVFNTPGDFTLRATATDNRGASASADRRVRVVAAATANNDAFASAAALPGGADTVLATTTSRAGRESGEPAHAGNSGGHSLWWRWTPTAAGTAVITTRGSGFDTLLAVYTGTSFSGLTAVAANDDDGDGFGSYVRFTVQAGVSYAIAVDGYGGALGDVALTVLHSATAATNDSFAARAALTGSSASVAASTIVATRESGEPTHGGPGSRSVWWTWTAPDNGTLNLSTVGSTFDTLLSIYTGTAVAALTRIAADDDSGGDFTSSLSTAVTRGTVYQIAVDGFGAADGRARLSLGFLAAGARPANDNFASRAALSGSPVTLVTSSLGGTKETGEPNHAGSYGGSSLWWSWTAPGDGGVSVSTEGSNFDTVLAVYTGTSFTALSPVAADDDGGENNTSRVSFSARAGTTYMIAVDGYNRAAGSVTLFLTYSTDSAVAGPSTRLINVATRGLSGSGSSTMIAGFTVTGSSAKPVMIRAIGPTLRGFGLTTALVDPVLSLYRGETRLAVNDNWEDNANRTQIIDKAVQNGAFALTVGAKDAVLLTTLSPGSYTATITAATGTSASGVALVEVYDVDVSADADATGRRLINLSTRGSVGTGENILIAGLVVQGTDNKRILIRGIGPTLGVFGVTGVLADPQIVVVRGSTTVASNDNWGQATNASEIATVTQQVGGFALTAGSRDAALFLTLPPGTYTVQLSGVNNTSGNGLIEAYEVP
jgi:hypothetical protein